MGVSPVEDTVRAALERTAEKLGFTRSVEVLQSALVKAPVVVGYFRPVILLPLSVLTGLPEPQLALILAHELAHIRRHDYLVNLIQTLVETLFFYHPGVWWLSREIRKERENCCDDVAMSMVDRRADYGEALLAVARLHAASTPLSLAAQGGSLVSRMRRIAGCEPAPRLAGGGSILGIVLVSMAILVGVTWDTAPATAESEQDAVASETDTGTEATDAVLRVELSANPDGSLKSIRFAGEDLGGGDKAFELLSQRVEEWAGAPGRPKVPDREAQVHTDPNLGYESVTRAMTILTAKLTPETGEIEKHVGKLTFTPLKNRNVLAISVEFERGENGARVSRTPVVVCSDQVVDIDEVGEYLRSWLEQQSLVAKDVTLILRADSDAPVEMIQGLIKQAQSVGFERFALRGDRSGAEPDEPAVLVSVTSDRTPADEVLQRTLRFSFRFEPWADVLEWFAEEADLELVMNTPPPGTFNYSDAKQYTPQEALDILNSVLLTHDFILIKWGKKLIVHDLSQGTHDDLVLTGVTGFDIEGAPWLSTVRIHVVEGDATSALAELATVKGVHGEVVLLPTTGELQITATARNMATMVALINGPLEPPKEQASEKPEETVDGAWQSGQTIDVQVINAKTEEPLPGVKLEFQYHGPGIDFQDITTKTTDAEGRSQGRLPDLRPDAVRIYPTKAGFVPLRVYWGDDLPSPKLPKSVTIRMEPGTVWGGVVQDEESNPIPDVKVCVHYWETGKEFNPHRRVNLCVEDTIRTTDKNGRWQLDVMPAEFGQDGPSIFVTHPDYVSDHLQRGHTPRPVTERPPYEALRAQTAVMVMRQGGVIEGRVIDEAGQPVSGVQIRSQESYGSNSSKPAAATGEDGRFRIANLSFALSGMNDPPPETSRAIHRREVALVVQADGYTPQLVHVAPDRSVSPLEITLKPGQAVEGRVTDESGKPLDGVTVSVSNWLGYRSRLSLGTKTNTDGTFRLRDAPSSGALYFFHKKGYMAVQDLAMSPQPPVPSGDGGYHITLKAPLAVAGSIVDAETGQPLAKCTVMRGVEFDDGRAPHWERGRGVKTITDGQYEFEFADGVFFWRVRVEAEGYMPAVSRILRSGSTDKGRVTYDFKLSKAPPLSGKILDGAGKPLAGAEVYLATYHFRVNDGKADSESVRNARMTRTDVAGRFELPPEVEPFYLVVLHSQGFAVVDERQFEADSTVRIEPWAGENRSFEAERRPHTHSRSPVAADAEGVLTVRLVDKDGKPVEGARAGSTAYFQARPNRFVPYGSNWSYYPSSVSNRDGKVRIADPSMNSVVVARHDKRGLVAIGNIRPEAMKRLDEKTLTMHPHCKIFGKLTAKELEARGRKLTWSNVYLNFFVDHGTGRAMSCSSVKGDYHFYVPPGRYTLYAYATDTQHAQKTITVEPGQQELEVEPIDLPPQKLVLLEGQPAPELRDVVAWKNGGPVKLSDLKGKVVVLAFSSRWVARRPRDWMPNLFTICDKYRDQGLEIIDIRLDGGFGDDGRVLDSLDEKIAEVKSPFWEDRDLPIPIALGISGQPTYTKNPDDVLERCGILEDYGITSYPSSVLIDRQGRIVGKFDLRSDRDNGALEELLKDE